MNDPRAERYRKIEIIGGILATLLLAVGLLTYALFEPQRLVQAQENLLQSDLDTAMTLYAENCAVCHGLDGSGIGATPALNTQGLAESDPAVLEKIIARGLYNTAMPAWSKEDGGPLSEYQISQMVALIQYGNWQETQDRVVNLGLAPLVPFAADPDTEVLAYLATIEGGDVLAQGVTLYAENCVACHGADGLGTTLAPALNDPNVRAKPADDLLRTILYGSPGTLMAGWEKILPQADVDALMVLITQWEQVPTGAIPAPDTPIPVTEESLAMGAEYYTANCSQCHGPEGQGTLRAPALNVKGFLEETSDLAIQQIVTLGVPGTAMPAWGDRLTDAQIQAVVGFIRAWEPNAPEVAEPARGGGGPWWQTQGNTNGTNTAGGSRGGPPWQRNNSTITQTPPESSAEITLPTPTSLPLEPTLQALDNGTPGSLVTGEEEIIIIPTSTTAAAEQHSAQGQGAGSGGPPWAQADQQEENGFVLDSQVWVLFGSVGGTALLMISWAVIALKRLT
jgi:cbb3-type cytochrome c oxidase subunit III